jgi:hypothetical protein
MRSWGGGFTIIPHSLLIEDPALPLHRYVRNPDPSDLEAV